MTDTVEVVIKLDKADLEAVRSMGLNRTQEAVRKRVDSAIQHGTVLPKGHGRLIDESAILDAIDVAIHFANKEGHEYANAFENNGRWCAEYNSIENMIASTPTIIQAESEDKE